MQKRIDFRFTELNKYISAERGNKFAAATIKEEETEVARLAFLYEKRAQALPLFLTFHWHCVDMRRNPDNIAFAKKFIIDGMVAAGYIENDGWKQVAELRDTFHVDESDYVVVEISSMSRYKADGE